MKTRAPDRKGFTLLEIMVAAAVAVLVVAGALAVVVNALAWNERASGRQRARAEALLVLDRVATDLAALCRRAGPEAGLAATITDSSGTSGLWEPAANGQPDGQLELEVGEVAAMRFGIGGVWLRFVAQVAGTEADGGSQPRVIAYQVVRRREPGGIAPRYWLHRSVVRAAAAQGRPGTWEAGWDFVLQADSGFMHAEPGNDGSVAGDPLGVVRPEAAANCLAGDVVDFGVRFLAAVGDGTWRVIFPAGPNDRECLVPTGQPYPPAVDLLVRVLTPEGARRLAAFESGTGGPGLGSAWWDVVATNSEVVTRRVVFPGGER